MSPSSSRPDLWLHEEVTLLALSDDKGTVETGNWYPHVVAGAVLAELMLAGRLRVQTDEEAKAKGSWLDKRLRVEVTKNQPLGEPLIDQWLASMAEVEKLRPVTDWLGKIAHSSKLRDQVAGRLAERGILEVQQDKVLWVFNRTRYPESNPGPEKEIRARLDEAIFTDTRDVDARTIVLLSLIKQGEFLPHLFDKKEFKRREDRIKQLIEGEALGQATAKVIESVQAAVIIACTTAVVATTAT